MMEKRLKAEDRSLILWTSEFANAEALQRHERQEESDEPYFLFSSGAEEALKVLALDATQETKAAKEEPSFFLRRPTEATFFASLARRLADWKRAVASAAIHLEDDDDDDGDGEKHKYSVWFRSQDLKLTDVLEGHSGLPRLMFPEKKAKELLRALRRKDFAVQKAQGSTHFSAAALQIVQQDLSYFKDERTQKETTDDRKEQRRVTFSGDQAPVEEEEEEEEEEIEEKKRDDERKWMLVEYPEVVQEALRVAERQTSRQLCAKAYTVAVARLYVDESLGSENSFAFADVLRRLAKVQLTMGTTCQSPFWTARSRESFQMAIENLRVCLFALEKNLGPSHAAVAYALNDFGVCVASYYEHHSNMKKIRVFNVEEQLVEAKVGDAHYDLAEGVYRRAAAIFLQSYDFSHNSVRSCLHNLCRVLKRPARTQAATTQHQKELHFLRTLLGAFLEDEYRQDPTFMNADHADIQALRSKKHHSGALEWLVSGYRNRTTPHPQHGPLWTGLAQGRKARRADFAADKRRLLEQRPPGTTPKKNKFPSLFDDNNNDDKDDDPDNVDYSSLDFVAKETRQRDEADIDYTKPQWFGETIPWHLLRPRSHRFQDSTKRRSKTTRL